MQGQNKERWQELCALAVKEQDPEKLVELTGAGKLKKKKGGQHQPELPQLGRRSVDHCDVFPVALRVEAIYLNRLRSMKLMFRAAIGTAHWINGRSCRPGPSKQQLCSAWAIHHSLLRSWHQVRFALKAERQMSLRVTVTPFWRRPRNLIGRQQCHGG